MTHNRADFARLATEFAAEGRSHAGLVLCVRRPPRVLADRICSALHAAAGQPLTDRVLCA